MRRDPSLRKPSSDPGNMFGREGKVLRVFSSGRWLPFNNVTIKNRVITAKCCWKNRFGDEERTVMHLVPAAAVRLMKRRVLSRPGVRPLLYHGTPVKLVDKIRESS
jgi:hypothetical protein